jgi:hypothetical protein
VRPIPLTEARAIIERREWLGKMPAAPADLEAVGARATLPEMLLVPGRPLSLSLCPGPKRATERSHPIRRRLAGSSNSSRSALARPCYTLDPSAAALAPLLIGRAREQAPCARFGRGPMPPARIQCRACTIAIFALV